MKRLNLTFVIVMLILFLLGIEIALNKYKKTMMDQIETQTRLELKEKAQTLQSEIYQDFILINGMEAYITNDFLKNETPEQVNQFLSKIYDGTNQRVQSIVIAPKGVYEYVYPFKGNEKLINHNILQDKRPIIIDELKRANKTKEIIISQPYELLQGKTGIVARKAIFQDGSLWGYVNIGLSLSHILSQAGISAENSSLNVTIRLPGQEPFWGNKELFYKDNKIMQEIRLLDGVWEIAASPIPSKMDELNKQLMAYRMIGYFISLLVVTIFIILFTERERLNKLVVSRTKDLNKAHHQLSEVIEEMKASENELVERNQQLAKHAVALEDSEKKLTHLAFYDQLTGIANRMYFTKVLDECLNEDDRDGAIIYFDLDNFKMVNDTYGHETGDILLKSVSTRISDANLPVTIFARLGGDEFGIVVNDTDKTGAKNIAKDILRLFHSPFQLPEKLHYMNTSIGISLFDGQNRDFKTLLKHADITMYNAKRSGGNKIRVFHPDMNKDANMKIELSNDLRQAIKNDELILHYQPQVDSRSGNIIGVEALVRWNHPTKGLLSPAGFIDVAEETGLIIELGEWVLRKACTDIGAMIDSGLPLIPLAINLSAKQFQDEGLVEKMKQILFETKFPPHLLEFEITESTAMKDEQLVILDEIKQLGINISIDDFGTHYSSLSYLKRFPINKVKIDRSFIRGIKEDDRNLAILRAIINVARDLGIDTIAEGVETTEEVQILSDYDCYHLQGFLYYKPLPISDLINSLQVKKEKPVSI
ncbi:MULTISPECIES: EAL domain-containing protein [unclassified Bacillus (in: firmicutes)]|uniref:bifunctional diguanylate cyclase/phosphodiesterase n=1 Tax=unclassified Bacillus (in: firmicutes) TaxID=185979 RepID=UPI0008F3A47F|nr:MULTISPECIES: EAL domain-containing protein [unclassified Bacillus (in: firmicutes)]SFA87424.1 diguanylate cyclase (GGDEF) domain-containing protein [Bacillus sp. UNCCL13]SFQ84240.1 diguanylate cyclase (GGDEF) domain-containing protein [Bacillus sp. cl95]